MAVEPAVFAVADLNVISKEVFPWSDPYWDFLEQSTPGLDLIESTRDIPFGGKAQGRYYTFKARTGSHANPMVGVSSNQRSTGLPKAGKQKWDELKYRLARHHQALEMEGAVFDDVVGGESSVADGFTMEMENQGRDARKEHNCLLHGDGSGAISVPATWDDATGIITMDDTSRFQEGTEFVIRADGTGDLYTGQTSGVAMVCTSVLSTTSITATLETGAAFNLGGAPTSGTFSGYSCFRYDQQGAVVNGLGIICSDSDPTNWGDVGVDALGGLLRADEPLWAAYINDIGGSQLSVQSHVLPTLDTIKSRGGQWLGKDESGARWYGFCGYQNFRIVENAMRVGERSAPLTTIKKKDYEYQGIDIEGAFFVIDDDSPPSAIRFVCPNDLRRMVRRPWFWDDRSGSIWRRTLADDGREADIFKASMFTSQQLIAVRCRTMGAITNTLATM